jgi:hypothetical protein
LSIITQEKWNRYLSLMGKCPGIPFFKIRLEWVLFILLFCSFEMLSGQENAPLAKGAMQWNAHLWWIDSDHYYNRDGVKEESLFEYSFYNTHVRALHALSDRLRVAIGVPVINIAYTRLPLSGQKATKSGVGDIDAGFHYTMLPDSAFQLIGILQFQIPTTTYNDNLSIGSGSFDQLIKLQAYRYYHIGNADAWIGLAGGFNNRGKEYNNELRYSAETGWFLDDNKVEVSLTLHGFASLGTSESNFRRIPETLFANQKEEQILSPALQFKLSRAFTVGLRVDALLSGRNRSDGTAFQISIRRKSS